MDAEGKLAFAGNQFTIRRKRPVAREWCAIGTGQALAIRTDGWRGSRTTDLALVAARKFASFFALSLSVLKRFDQIVTSETLI
jgi:hypothetical protein